MSSLVSTRIATEWDSSELCKLLNEIITIGGTTAMETPLTEAEFSTHYLTGPDYISCFVAIGQGTEVYGFQALEYNSKLAVGWADIATFVRGNSAGRGIGNALFYATVQHARDNGIDSINATIRADNTVGLAYYSKIGFVDYSVAAAMPLKDGTLVDRISKVYSLG